MSSANDFLMGGGGRSAKFPAIGAVVTGTISGEPELIQQRVFGTTDPKFYDDGKPAMQTRIPLDTDLREDDEDDGQRSLYVAKPAMKAAIRDAVRKAGAAGLEVGGKLTVKYAGDAKSTKPGFKGAMQFAAKYVAPVADPFEAEPVAAAASSSDDLLDEI